MAENTQAPAPPPGTPSLRAMVPDLVIDGALPAIAYQILTRYGVAVVPALTAGAIFPMANIVWKFIATRSLDLVGALVLGFLAIGVVSSLLSGNVLFVLVKESFITGLVGLLFLSSLLWKRPIIFYVARQVMEAEGAERLAWWNSRWEHARFRRTMRIMTTVWGVGYVLEAAIRVVCALTMTPGTVVILSPIMGIGTTIGLIVWTRRYGQIAQARAAREDVLAAAAQA
jgi:hypothetical protein